MKKKHHRSYLVFFAATLVLIGCTACKPTISAHSKGSITVDGRKVEFTSDQLAAMESTAEGIKLTLGAHRFDILGERFSVDGVQLAILPKGATNVTIKIDKGNLEITADHRRLMTTRVP